MAPSPVKKSKQEVEKAAATAAAAQTESASTAADAASDDEDDQEEDKTETLKSKADESNAMDKLTDVVEEKQMDEDKMKQAFQALRKQEEADKEAERKRYELRLPRLNGLGCCRYYEGHTNVSGSHGVVLSIV